MEQDCSVHVVEASGVEGKAAEETARLSKDGPEALGTGCHPAMDSSLLLH